MEHLHHWQKLHDKNPEAWRDCYDYLMQSRLFDPDSKGRMTIAYHKVAIQPAYDRAPSVGRLLGEGRLNDD